MVDSDSTADITVTLTITATINKPVARHWGVRIDRPDEVVRLIHDELTARDFDPEGPILGLLVDVPDSDGDASDSPDAAQTVRAGE